MHRSLGTPLTVITLVTLTACTSHFEGRKLGEDGHLAANADGIPYLLPRPEFMLTKSQSESGPIYTLAIGHVPDPSQRYTLRTNPALFANVESGVTVGATGQLADVNATFTENVTPTITALGSFAASVLSALAVLADVSTVDATIKAKLDVCEDAKTREDLESFLTFLVRDARPDATGKLNADDLLSARIHVRSAAERHCLTQIRRELQDERAEVLKAQAQAFQNGLRDFDPKKKGDEQFVALLMSLDQQYRTQERGNPNPIRELRAAVEAAGLIQNFGPLVRLGITAVEDITRDDLQQWQRLLSVHPASHDGATGLERAVQLLGEALGLPPGRWRARHLIYLEDCLDEGALALVQNVTPTCPEYGREPATPATLESMRRRIAVAAGQEQNYSRLVKLEAYLDQLPPNSASGESSAFEEYARARGEAELLRTRIAAAVTSTIDRAKSANPASKPQAVPLIDMPRIEASHRCDYSKTLAGQRDPVIAVVMQLVGPDGVPPPIKPPAACIDDPNQNDGSAP
jgi:hypothetical protein